MYIKLKDIITSSIPKSYYKPALSDINSHKVAFAHFIDDDVGGAMDFNLLFDFLHNHYFLHIS